MCLFGFHNWSKWSKVEECGVQVKICKDCNKVKANWVWEESNPDIPSESSSK